MLRILLSLLALVFLNGLFTFGNVPSTPLVRFTAQISVEFLVLAGVVAILRAWGLRSKRLYPGFLAVAVCLAGWIRYVDVTVLGVLGRPFDAYGDSPHVHRVIAGFLESMTLGLAFGVITLVVVCIGLSLWVSWVAVRSLQRACDAPTGRWAIGMAAAAGLVASAFAPGWFSHTTEAIVARQIQSLRVGPRLDDVAGLEVPPARISSKLSALRQANVFIVFVESYGITLLDDRKHRDVIGPRFASMEANLRRAGYAMASSQIISPTFGGGSWRAHASLLSGFETSSERVYDALLQSNRPTLVGVLKNKGYRTIAVEPGIQRFWPEGLFFGFDKIYDFKTLDYRGPAIGWWKVPDQYTLYRVFQEEIKAARSPVFAKFSLIMTHIPYFPVPEYVADWTRFDQGTAYQRGLHSVAHDAYRDLLELSGWYLAAVRYELDVLEGFLVNYVPDNSLVIILGDHQPPKLATHDSNSWAVPMHVLSKRSDLVRAFDGLGFEDSLVPSRPSSLRMSEFLDNFLRIYED